MAGVKNRSRKCCKCGNTKSRIGSIGYEQWYSCSCKKIECTGHICYSCNLIGKQRTIDHYLGKRKGRECRECGTDLSGIEGGVRYYNKEGYWDGKSYECLRCHGRNYQNNDVNSQHNIMKYIANCRTGNVSRYATDGKGIIGQWIGTKTLNIEDYNVKYDNFTFWIDSYHSEYGYSEIKTMSLNPENGEWRSGKIRRREFDIILCICMDEFRPWINVEKVYAISWEAVGARNIISIAKNSFRKVWYEDFRIDEKPFNDIYHSVDIPNFFSPFDLWNGKYNKNKEY